MGHALERLDPGRADPLPPHAGHAHEVDLRHRPRRHRHPGAGRAASSRPRAPAARRPRPRGVHRAGVGVARAATARTIVEQFKRLGASCDYEDERFTLDPSYARAVMKVFVALYEKGLIYRDNYMVNWDPGPRSAISDLEVEEREVEDTLYSIDYPLEGGGGLDHRRHRAAGDDAGRHRDRRPSRRRALHAPGRRGRDPAARRPPAADHRRRTTSSPSSAPAR